MYQGKEKIESSNNTEIAFHEIESIARCLQPSIVSFFESDEGKEEYEKWLMEQE